MVSTLGTDRYTSSIQINKQLCNFINKTEVEKNMEKQIKMPKLRPEMKSGVLCSWLKEEGDTINVGDPIYEIETDKVVNQIEATESGILRKQLIEEGDSVDVDAPVAIIEEDSSN